jgi:hypothetical protein
MLPSREFEYNCKSDSELMSPIDVGILPTNWLLNAKNIFKFDNFPNSDGILPNKLFESIVKVVKEIIFPIDVGKLPIIPLVERDIDTTSEFASHDTPVHGEHIEVRGPPLPHRQPLTSSLLPRFVDAAKSHKATYDTGTVEVATIGEFVTIDVGIACTSIPILQILHTAI